MAAKPGNEQVAIVTGGARRIGAATARALHQMGMRIAVHYRESSDAAHALQTELNEIRENSVVLVRGDLSDVSQGRSLVRATLTAFGRIDLLVNNASTFYPTPFGRATEKQWDELLAINLKAPFFLAQAATPSLRDSAGAIINIVDIYAERPLMNYSAYCVAKGGLVTLTRALARELAPAIRVNAIAPGAIIWPDDDIDDVAKQRIVSRTPLKRRGDGDDIARAVVYLIRDAGFVTGQVIRVDGGRSVVP